MSKLAVKDEPIQQVFLALTRELMKEFEDALLARGMNPFLLISEGWEIVPDARY